MLDKCGGRYKHKLTCSYMFSSFLLFNSLNNKMFLFSHFCINYTTLSITDYNSMFFLKVQVYYNDCTTKILVSEYRNITEAIVVY